MRGSYFMSRYIEYIEAARAEARRGGKPISRTARTARTQQIDRLTAMRVRLASGHATGHDTLEAALRELASFALQPRVSPSARAHEQVLQQQPLRPRTDEALLYTVTGGRRRTR
ncbi:MAG TPA: hypothetical protein VE338_12530 [Ktedonobacterales bacterium]|jgi:hypothetical protein|nr:hypothetical protein [Ktedonobacterales bacterium]